MRKPVIAALAVLLLALGACGTSLKPDPGTRATAQPVATHHAAAAGYHNPKVLAKNIWHRENLELENAAGPYYQAGVHVTSVQCIEQGSRAATCLIRASDGVARSEQLVISADGTQWLPK